MVNKLIFSFAFIICSNCYSQCDTINANRLKPLNKKDPNYFCEVISESIISMEGFRKNGMLNGEIRFYSTRKLIEVITYVDDVPNGFYAVYYIPSGNIYLIGNFKNGKKEGVIKEYDINGKLISTKKYHNDVQIE